MSNSGGKTLLLFLLTPTIGGYINAISYSCEDKGVTEIRFIYVRNRDGALDQQIGETKAEYLCNSIRNELEEIPNKINSAIDQLSKINKDKVEEAKTTFAKALKSCPKDGKPTTIDYPHFTEQLNEIMKQQGGPNNCNIDITGTSKQLGIDIFSAALAIGFKNVYSFELLPSVSKEFPDRLYPFLNAGQYTYVPFSDSKIVQQSREALLRRRPVFWAILIASALSIISALITVAALQKFGSHGEAWNILSIVSSLLTIISFIAWIILERTK